MTVMMEGLGTAAAPLAELKAYLKVTLADDDALLDDLLRAATDMAERFTGQIMIDRGVGELMPITGGWQRLSVRPVRALTAVAGVPAEGSEYALPVEAYALDIDRNGDGWIRVSRPGGATRVRVTYRAGVAADDTGVPEAIRHGVIRLAGEYYARRAGELRASSGGLDVQPPAAVAALWRPWRRMRLS